MQLVFFVFGKHVIIIIIIALIQVDQKRRNSDGIRSTSFLKDEDNTSIAITPSKDGGYVGCYVDTEEDRDMKGQHTFNTHSSSMLPAIHVRHVTSGTFGRYRL